MHDSDEQPIDDQQTEQPEQSEQAGRDAASEDAVEDAAESEPVDPTLQLPRVRVDAPDAPSEAGAAVECAEEPAAPAEEPILAAPRVAIVQVSGADDGVVTSLSTGEIVIGRMGDNLNVTLRRDQWVSRRHASLTYRDGSWWLEDLNSSNGTFLGDEREQVSAPTRLQVGQVFRVGHTDLLLTDDPEHLSHGATAL